MQSNNNKSGVGIIKVFKLNYTHTYNRNAIPLLFLTVTREGSQPQYIKYEDLKRNYPHILISFFEQKIAINGIKLGRESFPLEESQKILNFDLSRNLRNQSIEQSGRSIILKNQCQLQEDKEKEQESKDEDSSEWSHSSIDLKLKKEQCITEKQPQRNLRTRISKPTYLQVNPPKSTKKNRGEAKPLAKKQQIFNASLNPETKHIDYDQIIACRGPEIKFSDSFLMSLKIIKWLQYLKNRRNRRRNRRPTQKQRSNSKSPYHRQLKKLQDSTSFNRESKSNSKSRPKTKK